MNLLRGDGGSPVLAAITTASTGPSIPAGAAISAMPAATVVNATPGQREALTDQCLEEALWPNDRTVRETRGRVRGR